MPCAQAQKLHRLSADCSVVPTATPLGVILQQTELQLAGTAEARYTPP